MNFPASAIGRTAHALLQGRIAVRIQPIALAAIFFLQYESSRRNDVYTILWAVVFGFATMNILGLAARRFEPNRRGLTFGEMMAVLIVLLSVFMLAWELLNVFHVLPIKIEH